MGKGSLRKYKASLGISAVFVLCLNCLGCVAKQTELEARFTKELLSRYTEIANTTCWYVTQYGDDPNTRQIGHTKLFNDGSALNFVSSKLPATAVPTEDSIKEFQDFNLIGLFNHSYVAAIRRTNENWSIQKIEPTENLSDVTTRLPPKWPFGVFSLETSLLQLLNSASWVHEISYNGESATVRFLPNGDNKESWTFELVALNGLPQKIVVYEAGRELSKIEYTYFQDESNLLKDREFQVKRILVSANNQMMIDTRFIAYGITDQTDLPKTRLTAYGLIEPPLGHQPWRNSWKYLAGFMLLAGIITYWFTNSRKKSA
jgi:hypothetical protein